jgi:predicted DNA-binding mobile mystery protein A
MNKYYLSATSMPTKSPVKAVVRKQYMHKSDAAMQSQVAKKPPEGWVRTLRKALDMSGSQLANIIGLSRNRISVLERREVEGEITLNQLHKLAQALDADLVYALVPRSKVVDRINDRAFTLAEELVDTADVNMFLEQQQVSNSERQAMVDQVANQLVHQGGKALWQTSKDRSNG